MTRRIRIKEGSVDLHLHTPVRRQIDVVLPVENRCPEGVIVGEGEGIPVVIHCERIGGHDGNHHATTDRGTAEWPRIEPRQRPDEPAPF